MKSFDKLGGAPTHYSREPVGIYGTRGEKYEFKAKEDFYNKLNNFFNDLWTYPCRKAEVIVSAGVQVNKEGPHGKGEAIDIDSIFWNDKSLVTKRDGYEKKNIFLYLGVEAVLRRHFGTVLNYDYVEHEDHFHVDDGSGPIFDPSWKNGVTIGFLQAVSTYLFDRKVGDKRLLCQRKQQEFNRQFDDDTKNSISQAMIELGMTEQNYTNLSDKTVWHNFLKLVAEKAFDMSQHGKIPKTPRDLLGEVYDEANKLTTPSEKQALLEALNAFRNHPQTDIFISHY